METTGSANTPNIRDSIQRAFGRSLQVKFLMKKQITHFDLQYGSDRVQLEPVLD